MLFSTSASYPTLFVLANIKQLEVNALIVGSIVLFSAIIMLILLFVLQYRKKQTQFMLEKKQMEHQFEQEKLKVMLEIQNSTYHDISLEIHDNIIQVISAANKSLQHLNLTQQCNTQNLNQISQQLSESISYLRNISHHLNPNYFQNFSLLQQIQADILKLEETQAFQVEFVDDEDVYSLNIPNQVIIYRTFQEALGNIIKHAQCSWIRISIKKADSKFIHITIQDNGKGFDTHTLPAQRGIGLKNMEHRMNIIQGSCIINSIPNQGTTIHLNLPYEE